ncbi:MAG TPA: hypothetical protein VGC26_09240, partial [Afipia sp.]
KPQRTAHSLCNDIASCIQWLATSAQKSMKRWRDFSKNHCAAHVSCIVALCETHVSVLRAKRFNTHKTDFADSESQILAMKLFSGVSRFAWIAARSGKLFGCFSKTDSGGDSRREAMARS